MLSFLLDFIIALASRNFGTSIDDTWLSVIRDIAGCICFATPGVTIWFWPRFAYAWISGINTFLPQKPWEELSSPWRALLYPGAFVVLFIGCGFGYDLFRLFG
jgi:hypothetical protein